VRNPENTDGFILWLFNSRCVGLDDPCYKFTREINEIEPRSSRPDALEWINRVTLCHEHHMEYHNNGVSDEAIRKLKERRAEYLETIGRHDYIDGEIFEVKS